MGTFSLEDVKQYNEGQHGEATSSWANPFPLPTEPYQHEEFAVGADIDTVCALPPPITGEPVYR